MTCGCNCPAHLAIRAARAVGVVFVRVEPEHLEFTSPPAFLIGEINAALCQHYPQVIRILIEEMDHPASMSLQ